jgi:hypothetical protein
LPVLEPPLEAPDAGVELELLDPHAATTSDAATAAAIALVRSFLKFISLV